MSNFLFPIETTARELDQRIVMAILASKKNRKILVGEQQFLRNISFFIKSGVFFGKHLFGKHKFSDQNYYKRLKRNGFSVIHLNEEGAIWPGNESDWRNIMEFDEKPSVLDKDDYLLEWGQYQKDFYENLEPHNTNIVVTGHPRFDLYKEKYIGYFNEDKKYINKKYGNFILVNTSTSWSNNGEGGNKITFKKTMFYNPDSNKDRVFRFGKWVSQARDLANLVELINAISLEFPDRRIIIRPHPSENSKTYKDIFQNIKNVEVVYEGNSASWILACDILIHSSSTTAIEAALANKPIINYKPYGLSQYDVKIPCLLGFECPSVGDAIEYIREYAGKNINYDFSKLPEYAKNMFQNFTANSFDLILPILEKADHNSSGDKNIANIKLKAIGFINEIYHLLKKIYLVFNNRIESSKDFKKRFEKLDPNKLLQKINAAEAVVGKKVKFTYINQYLFVIESES